MKSEHKIQAEIIRELKRCGYYVLRQYANTAGTPDIVACSPTGRFCAFEVKTEKGKATELQLYNLEQVKKCEGIARVVRSIKDIQEDI